MGQVPALELRNVHKRFGDAVALNGIDLKVSPGEIVVLLGPSGCGKSTCLRLMAGFDAPSAGEVIIGGDLVAGARKLVGPERRGVGMMFQSYALWPHMTVGQNVGYGLRIRGIDRADRRRRVAEMLDVVKMMEYIDRYPSELSGGQQQRVALARAMVVEPKIILMDEPLSNLDASLRNKMRIELRQLHERLGFTGVYVTHDQAEAMAVADRIVLLNDGRIEQIDGPLEIFQSPSTEFAARFIGQANCMAGTYVGESKVRIGDSVRVVRIGAYRPAIGSNVIVVLRPSDLSLGDTGEGSIGEPIECVVEYVVHFGSAIECKLTVPEFGTTLLATFSPSTTIERGSEVVCTVRDMTIVAPSADGKNVNREDGESDTRAVSVESASVAAT